jgi:hypothetical protein
LRSRPNFSDFKVIYASTGWTKSNPCGEGRVEVLKNPMSPPRVKKKKNRKPLNLVVRFFILSLFLDSSFHHSFTSL